MPPWRPGPASADARPATGVGPHDAVRRDPRGGRTGPLVGRPSALSPEPTRGDAGAMSIASLEPIVGRHVDLDRVRRALATARRAGRSALLEPEGLEVLDAIGIAVPDWLFAPIDCLRAGGGVEPRDLALLHGERLVVKVVAEAIAHKTELGGVRVVERDHTAVLTEMRAMAGRLA